LRLNAAIYSATPTALWVPEQYGPALSLGAVTTDRVIGTADARYSPALFSVAFWWKPSRVPPTGSTTIPMFWGLSGGTYGILFQWGNSTAGNRYAWQQYDGSVRYTQLPSQPTENMWHLFAASWDGATIRYYTDGAFAVSRAKTAHNWSTGGPPRYNTDLDAGRRPEGGTFGPIMAWGRPLAAQEIAALWNDPFVLLRTRLFSVVTATTASAVNIGRLIAVLGGSPA
jgi:hypothetical protein